MYQSASNFYNRYGVMPADCFEEMETWGMIEMKQNVVDSWDFQCDWEFDDAEKDIESIKSRMASEYELPPYDFIG